MVPATSKCIWIIWLTVFVKMAFRCSTWNVFGVSSFDPTPIIYHVIWRTFRGWPTINWISCILILIFLNYFWLTRLEIYLSTYLTQWQKNTVANQDCCSHSIVKFGHQIVDVNTINSQNLIVNFFDAFKKCHFRYSVFLWWLIHKCYWFIIQGKCDNSIISRLVDFREFDE